MDSSKSYVLDSSSIQQLISALQERGYEAVGPMVRDNAIVYDKIESAKDLPHGWGDEQKPGTYRLRKRADETMFGFNLGPHSWKQFLFPPALKVFAMHRDEKEVAFDNDAVMPTVRDSSAPSELPRYAFLGVRSCELHAIAIQDKVFTGSIYGDSHYAKLREQAFIVAVNCTQAAATCFCTSMGTGPKAKEGFDLCITEMVGENCILMQIGSSKGEEVLKEIPRREANAAEVDRALRQVELTASGMQRQMVTDGINELLQKNLEHPHWQTVADRCLSCANCTLVCPTCFCHTFEDTTDLTGHHAERWRKWDSCFALDFSYIHGGSIRTSRKSRYRQWLMHKLANWLDQFGTSGCVGCGRCITWCPVGIDLTEEVRALRGHATTSSITNNVEVHHHGIT